MRSVPNTTIMSVLYFCGYCGLVTAHGVCVAASTVGATMPRTLRCQPSPIAGSQSRCSVRAATAVAVLQPSSDEAGALTEQLLDAGARQIDDLGRGAVAIGHVGVVAEIDERLLREARGQRPQHGQAANAGIEHADHAASHATETRGGSDHGRRSL